MKLNRPGWVFALVFAWKIALFLGAGQPVPANDAFFYDGAVVNRLLNGHYCNPALAAALPISGTDVFCAYPPLHQAALLGWMAVFGVSAWTAMTFHLALIGVYLLLLRALLRQVAAPDWAAVIAGWYVILLTFHDRPDTLAHVLGLAGVYAGLRWFLRPAGQPGTGVWIWGVVAAVTLAFTTSLQIGAIYYLLLALFVVGPALARRVRLPWAAMIVMTLAPVALVALVKFGYPHLWTGFLEHARQTPSFTGFRIPYPGEWLKVGRNAPAVLLVAILLPLWWRGRHRPAPATTSPGVDMLSRQREAAAWLALATLLAGLAVVGACLLVLTANTVAIANYLQPLLVGCFLTGAAAAATVTTAVAGATATWRTGRSFALLAGLALGSVRAVGMSTWGVACAWDVGYTAAIHRVDTELTAQPEGTVVVLSSAYLYEAARHRNVRWLHSDWLVPARHDDVDPDLTGLRQFHPRRLLLTQFDYYRRYAPELAKLRTDPTLADLKITNLAKIPPPDAYPSLQRVVQHISWAPVVVELTWR